MPRPPASFTHPLDTRSLDAGKDRTFELVPGAGDLDLIAAALDLVGLRKVRLKGTLSPVGARDWRLTAQLGATVVQPCVVTAAPVTTRLEVPVTRLYLRDWQDPDLTGEVEFDGDDESEPLESVIDLGAVLMESLSLALPDYPRAPGVDEVAASIAPPGAPPLDEAAVKPFAALAALKDKMKD
jgi:uncharacterized metal-binding protein YceD (DUF177 family)